MKHFLISRIDNIGDVVLTLPVAGVLKELYPDCKVSFLAKKYTNPILETSLFIDNILDWEHLRSLSEKDQLTVLKSQKFDAIIHVFPNKIIAKLARKARIPIRIGTARRAFHLINCNRKVNYSRRKSVLHEAQLNLKLLSPLGLKNNIAIDEISKYYGLNKIESLDVEIKKLLSDDKFNLVIHPKSKGSAREWGLDNFSKLIEILPAEKFNIFVTGSEDEGKIIHGFLEKYKDRVFDLTGKQNLAELVSFLYNCDGIVAASTGPLHIASALGINALGLYAPMRPIFPQRWAPVGKFAEYLVLEKKCNDCRKTKDCFCIRSISPDLVLDRLLKSNKISR